MVSVGNITIQGERLPLTLSVHIKPNGDFEAFLLFPDEYPETELWERHGPYIVKINGSIEKSKPWWSNVPTRSSVVYIHSFFGISPCARALATQQEAAQLRGIARRCMCAVLNALSRHVPVKNGFIALTAVGGCGGVDTPRMLSPDELTPRHMRAIARRLVANIGRENHQVRMIRRAIRSNDRATIAELNRQARRQRGLEAMYSRAFGLKVMTRDIDSAIMVGSYADALKRCAAKKAGHAPTRAR